MTNNSNSDEKFYFCTTETTFKDSYRNHSRDNKHQKYQNSAKLAK